MKKIMLGMFIGTMFVGGRAMEQPSLKQQESVVLLSDDSDDADATVASVAQAQAILKAFKELEPEIQGNIYYFCKHKGRAVRDENLSSVVKDIVDEEDEEWVKIINVLASLKNTTYQDTPFMKENKTIDPVVRAVILTYVRAEEKPEGSFAVTKILPVIEVLSIDDVIKMLPHCEDDFDDFLFERKEESVEAENVADSNDIEEKESDALADGSIDAKGDELVVATESVAEVGVPESIVSAQNSENSQKHEKAKKQKRSHKIHWKKVDKEFWQ